jgi:hypothetical protein
MQGLPKVYIKQPCLETGAVAHVSTFKKGELEGIFYSWTQTGLVGAIFK